MAASPKVVAVAASATESPSLIVKALRSEVFAWCIQNAVGAVFVALFAVVTKLQFALVCLAGVIYSITSTVLSLDRSHGGRFFSFIAFCGILVPVVMVATACITIAWQAATAPALVDALSLNNVVLDQKLAVELQVAVDELQKALVVAHTARVPEWLRRAINELLTLAYDDVLEPYLAQVQYVGDAFYGLLIGMFLVLATPATVQRARGGSVAEFGVGIVFLIVVLMLGIHFMFGMLVPVMGIKEYWPQVAGGYCKSMAVAAGGQFLATTFVFPCSTRGKVLQQAGMVLRGLAAQVQGLQDPAPAVAQETPLAASGAESEGKPGALRRRLAASGAWLSGACGFRHSQGVRPSTAAGTAPPLPATLTRLQDLKKLLTAALFEPPCWPWTTLGHVRIAELKALYGVLADVAAHVAALRHAARGMSESAGEEGAGAKEGAAHNAGHPLLSEAEAELAAVTDAMVGVLGRTAVLLERRGRQWLPGRAELLAAEAAQLAGDVAALQRMRLEALQRVAGGGGEAAAVRGGAAVGAAARDCGALLKQQNAALLCAAGVNRLAWQTAELEAAVAAACGLRHAGPAADPAAGAMGGSDGGVPASGAGGEPAVGARDAADIEANEADGAGKVDGTTDTPAAAAGGGAAAAAEAAVGGKPSLGGKVKAVVAHPWGGFLGATAVLGSGVAVVGLYLAACGMMAKFVVNAAHRRKVLRSRVFIFWLKFWFAVAATEVACLLFLWFTPAADPHSDPLGWYKSFLNLFLNWQPYYFWVTAILGMQQRVEGSLFRGVLRALPALPAGAIAWLLLVNGNLAASAVWNVCMVGLFNGLFSMLCVSDVMRYPTCAALFVFNAIILCQYTGICCVPGVFLYAWAKIAMSFLGAAWGIAFSWLLLPQYTRDFVVHIERRAAEQLVAATQSMAEAVRVGQMQPAAEVRGHLQAAVERLANASFELKLDSLQPSINWVTARLVPTPVVVRQALRDLVAAVSCVTALRSAMEVYGPAAAMEGRSQAEQDAADKLAELAGCLGGCGSGDGAGTLSVSEQYTTTREGAISALLRAHGELEHVLVPASLARQAVFGALLIACDVVHQACGTISKCSSKVSKHSWRGFGSF